MARAEEDRISEPLLEESRKPSGNNVSTYEDAWWGSRFGFSWMNDLIKRGRQKPLGVEDIPLLGAESSTEAAHSRFQEQWENTGVGRKYLAITLCRANWSLFILTGSLGVVKLCVMFAGPLLIQRFMDFTSQEDTLWFDGAKLVAFLVVTKGLEVWADHQYNFQQARLGVAVWSGLITAVYRKGLKITGMEREAHGVGQIINYMSVDALQVAKVFASLHELWLLPIQICVALVIIFGVVGAGAIAGLATMVIVMGICLLIARKQKQFQAKIMRSKDYRLKVTNEALSNMKIIKLCNWQEKFLQKVEDARAEEKVWVQRSMYFTALSIFFLWLSPSVVSVSTFGTCLLIEIPLTPGMVFTAIATFRILQEPLRSFPSVLIQIAQALVCVKRLANYLESNELDPGAVERLPWNDALEDDSVVVENGTFKWELKEEAPTLANINFRVKRGSLVVVVGTVGSGKSALLNSILGELEKVSGNVTLRGNVAYVPQSPWIQNGTIKDNILFGKPMDEALYKETIRVCALDGDLMQLTFGDNTEIGERGINLSGGQKQRIQLARAVYQDADVYLLDDIFSAVDAHTGTVLYQECVRGVLESKTVLLVTHQVEFLRGADLIVVMRDGKIAESGKYDELNDQRLDFSALVDAHNTSLKAHDSVERDVVAAAEEQLRVQNSDLFYSTFDSLNSSSVAEEENSSIQDALTALSQQLLSERENGLAQNGEAKLSKHANTCKPALSPPASESARLIEEEERGKGWVGFQVYRAYLTKVFFGYHLVILLFVQTVWQILQIASDFWVAYSTSSARQERFHASRFMKVYVALAIGSAVFVLFRSLIVTFSGLRTTQKFFLEMIRSVFRSPMSFFDTTPAGRVLTRSSTDQTTLDFVLPLTFGSFLAMAFQLMGVLAVMSKVTWQMLFFVGPLALIFCWYQMLYITASRELTRLEALTEAPIIQNFSETISGFTTIRAFNHQQRYIRQNLKLVNTNLAIKFHYYAANGWLGFRLEMIGTAILCSSSLLIVFLPKGVIQPENVGLSLSYGLALNTCLLYTVVNMCEVEETMVAVERVLQYSHLPCEAPLEIPEQKPPPSWPSKGSITMTNVQMRYRTDTPLVLKGVSFSVQGGDKLGVVGRTGSGKSSLIQVLFRLVELAGGSIVIDGVDISKIGLSDLRSKLSIISQEPTLFEGTVRTNLDPLGEHTDQEIWEALEKCQLADIVKDKDSRLEFPVAENGENWSMGQRQLFCLGRALLKDSTILVLDEATASVDTQTDVVIQKIISREFASSTVLTIAHRLPTIMNSGKVLVLDGGLVLEFGSPSSLLEKPSFFASLVEEYWNRSSSLHNLAAAGSNARNG